MQPSLNKEAGLMRSTWVAATSLKKEIIYELKIQLVLSICQLFNLT